MFAKILIANRGEIACRVIRTARRMGVRTVAVFSDADANALHVAEADEAVRIGAAPVGESYLRGDRILAAAKATGAQAIHPGYGFLSENPDFAEAVEAAGLVFIGPSAASIRAMGLKDAAKALMEKAGVPVVPGYHGDNQDPAFLAGCAEEIGYPVLIKARAGGGGKGMRRVDRAQDFAEALQGAQREAASAFGDPACLIEKYVTCPRHIEVQVFGDAHGNAVHLFERDCSLQRRHQKVIEEAPAPGMSEETRAEIGAAAVRAARAVDYRGAGTIEFIADASDGLRADRIWFMEMNTRLQVEHPVTEAITGLDLVEWQLRVAAGDPLPLRQEDLKIQGAAMEARLYAEDAPRGFLPQIGRLARLRLPEDVARIDSGVREGDEVTPHYDPMIAKVIAKGATRAEALTRLRAALAASEIAGLTTNLAFLRALLAHEGFAAGEMDTGLIDRELEALTAPAPVPPEAAALAAIASLGLDAPAPASAAAFAAGDGWRLWEPERRTVTLEGPEGETRVVLSILAPGRFAFATEAGDMPLTLTALGEGLRVRVGEDGPARPAALVRHGGKATVILDGEATAWTLPDPIAAANEAGGSGDAVAAPMPGLVKVVSAAPGDRVTEGQTLIVMEAMKMEHRLTAPRDGEVAELLCAEGAQVAEGAILLRLADPEAEAA
ncbi:acetyl/propionyl/methylcrotonyl-CoA carboxylase subunit alpha [Albimonas sp. CAU 1670]|uniref:acetyl-CoA carboxylase biotin carboxylase subunit n=1 Tax=Albimonas sp. CAU 1670 TaxID=3032599 RepID=UPI0023DA223B|nr:acetyl/propionyl/methylcrotonyl-CoA carboxylase subunit alpha [Albimonas sp. CAU 1670]MDF2231139.1 acetyl/propionyl/methylcrotonyl-CoA carboxylase subunit alpha [Albimonas sp. CAU 1670]